MLALILDTATPAISHIAGGRTAIVQASTNRTWTAKTVSASGSPSEKPRNRMASTRRSR